ncbi:MAG: hypothetical protein ACFFCL_14730 [Promethearchaeota archaeon]
MKEKLCPICSKIVRSDAELHDYCKLCGMGISVNLTTPRLKDKEGNVLYFCCNRCLSIYRTEIIKENNINRL